MNDADLVQGLRRQDPAAVQHLTQCYLPSVWRFVYVSVNGDRHLAEDIVSDTVLAFLQAVASPDADFTNPSAWLRSVASHKLHDHFRAVARVQHLINQAAANTGIEERDPAGHHEMQERRAAIRKVMDDLPEQQRLALEWKYLEQLSVRDIAGRLGLTEKAAESVLFRARREFREGLKGFHSSDKPCGADSNGTGGDKRQPENEAPRSVDLEAISKPQT